MLELVLLDGSERRFPIPEGSELTIGAAAQSTVRLQAADVSRQHAMIACQRGRTVVLDLGSTNGTFVNGRRVKEAELRAGDAVRFSSVLAQVLPPAGSGSGESTVRTGSSGAASGESSATTSDVIPMILQESLLWLLTRWASSDGDPVGALAEWFVVHRGLRGAAVLEDVGGEAVVGGAHGALDGVLDDPRCLKLTHSPAPPAGTVESVQLELGGQKAVGVRAAGGPWLLVLPGGAMPEARELELYVRLLGVAVRLGQLPQR